MGKALAVLFISALVGFVTEVSCITNGEFYELLKEHSNDFQEEDIDPTVFETEVVADDTAITLPGGPNDEIAIEDLLKLFPTDLANDADTPVSWWWNRPKHYPRHVVKGKRCHCKKDWCQCCTSHTYSINLLFKHVHITFHSCVALSYKPAKRAYYLHVWYNGKSVYNYIVDLQHPPSICYKVPGYHFSKVCLQLDHVNKAHRSVCVRVKGWISVVVKVFHVNLNIACFKLPRRDDHTLVETDHWALDEETRDQSIPSNEEMTHQVHELDDIKARDTADV